MGVFKLEVMNANGVDMGLSASNFPCKFDGSIEHLTHLLFACATDGSTKGLDSTCGRRNYDASTTSINKEFNAWFCETIFK